MAEIREKLLAAGLPNLWVPKLICKVDRIPGLGTGKLDLAGDEYSALWFGNAFFRSLGSGSTTRTFSADLYARLKDAPGNLFFSPLSVSAALAMADAAEETAGLPLGMLKLKWPNAIVVVADETETAAHAAVLAGIDKASGGHAVWRPAPSMTPGAMAQ